ncbi:hypothetical protein PU629_08395 [Pullulanibacillus sp. KACC 23026]|uniref:hypothetical protein n=1 Tax=Pullulanibacillus sp. KACC 23026 TaxID=3028315 RepID=UPI0023AF376A|nr:hypothetical protein [Pullulanibacillus sp. KACC 23026]WEG14367.1 hypothetical protein PU629_08395 [Pullulanibacillus sp. KACC 23026]
MRVINYLSSVEAGLGILMAIVLPHTIGYVFGGGLILGAVFTFFIGLGLNMMATFNDRQKGHDTTAQIQQPVESINKGI